METSEVKAEKLWRLQKSQRLYICMCVCNWELLYRNVVRNCFYHYNTEVSELSIVLCIK